MHSLRIFLEKDTNTFYFTSTTISGVKTITAKRQFVGGKSLYRVFEELQIDIKSVNSIVETVFWFFVIIEFDSSTGEKFRFVIPIVPYCKMYFNGDLVDFSINNLSEHYEIGPIAAQTAALRSFETGIILEYDLHDLSAKWCFKMKIVTREQMADAYKVFNITPGSGAESRILTTIKESAKVAVAEGVANIATEVCLGNVYKDSTWRERYQEAHDLYSVPQSIEDAKKNLFLDTLNEIETASHSLMDRNKAMLETPEYSTATWETLMEHPEIEDIFYENVYKNKMEHLKERYELMCEEGSSDGAEYGRSGVIESPQSEIECWNVASGTKKDFIEFAKKNIPSFNEHVVSPGSQDVSMDVVTHSEHVKNETLSEIQKDKAAVAQIRALEKEKDSSEAKIVRLVEEDGKVTLAEVDEEGFPKNYVAADFEKAGSSMPPLTVEDVERELAKEETKVKSAETNKDSGLNKYTKAALIGAGIGLVLLVGSSALVDVVVRIIK